MTQNSRVPVPRPKHVDVGDDQIEPDCLVDHSHCMSYVDGFEALKSRALSCIEGRTCRDGAFRLGLASLKPSLGVLLLNTKP